MNAIVPHQPSPLSPRNFNELIEFAERAARSSMVPKDYINRPDNILIAVQIGSELGLAPMQALQNIAVVNGRPSVFGDAMPALCRQSAVCEDIEERVEGDGDKMVAICVAKRVGKKPVEQRFSVDDAKKAGLWGKTGPWSQYPKRMLQMRARGFALRDAFPDVLRGLISAEEAADIPAPPFTGTTIDAATEPPPSAEAPIRQPAAAAGVARGQRKTGPITPADPATDGKSWVDDACDRLWAVHQNGKAWAELLLTLLSDAPTEKDVLLLGDVTSIQDGINAAPPAITRELTAAFGDAIDRFKPVRSDPAEPDAAGEPEPGDVEIAGAKFASA